MTMLMRFMTTLFVSLITVSMGMLAYAIIPMVIMQTSAFICLSLFVVAFYIVGLVAPGVFMLMTFLSRPTLLYLLDLPKSLVRGRRRTSQSHREDTTNQRNNSYHCTSPSDLYSEIIIVGFYGLFSLQIVYFHHPFM